MADNFGDQLLFIGGEFVTAESDEWLETDNPATGEVHGRVPVAGPRDIDRAVDAARKAQPDWAALTMLERRAVIRELIQGIRDRGDEVLPLEAADTGNTITKLARDIQVCAGFLDFYAGLGSEIKGEGTQVTADGTHFSLRDPYGVVARIIPFNHPFLFACAHLAAPLMAGNSVIVKTPESSPLSASILGEICQEVLPAGLVNLLSGPGLPTGDGLVRHPDIWRIGFTGSVGTGMAIQRSAAEVAVKHVSLELGGKNPLIICPDADPEKVAEAAVGGMNFAWAGQSCGSNSRLLIHESLYDEIIQRMEAMVSGIQMGDPRDPAAEMGPVNNRVHHERVMGFIDSAKQDGAKLVHGGKRPPGEQFSAGYWVEPTIYSDVTMDMRIAREEIFGPVLSVLKWSSLDQALEMANSTDYGLASGIWTRDLNQALKAVRKLQSGLVWVNTTARHFVGMPFGGLKNSGLGEEECIAELLSYTQQKSVHMFPAP